MESLNKRCVFLEHVVGAIGSSNIQIVRGRAEVKDRRPYARSFIAKYEFESEYICCI